MLTNSLPSDASLFTRALVFAAQAHDGQVRKGSDVPYIAHPVEAAAICATMTSDPVVLAAAVLHDVVEDTPVTVDDIRRAFGDRVAQIVEGESEDKRADRPAAETWEERKQETLNYVASTDDRDVLMVCLGDKLSNIRAMQRDAEALGDAVWDRFNQKNPAKQGWYYRGIAQVLQPQLGQTVAWREYAELVRAVFGEA